MPTDPSIPAGAELDLAVARAVGIPDAEIVRERCVRPRKLPYIDDDGCAHPAVSPWSPSTDPAVGLPLIEERPITIEYLVYESPERRRLAIVDGTTILCYGPTILIAGCRAIVAAGEER